MVVCKFGGTSLADADRIRHAADIIQADKARRYVVVSAPGKRTSEDEKITDLLLRCQQAGARGLCFSQPFQTVKERFLGIAAELGLDLPLEEEFDALEKALQNGASRDYAASRGEYFNGRIIAAYLGFSFVDASSVVAFDEKGAADFEKSVRLLAETLKKTSRAVIPGFYGTRPDGSVCVFSRGGSDVTGSLVAAAVNADLYENWTDVPGLMMVDPRIVPDARRIPEVTYEELRELSYMGATVLHEDAVFPVRSRKIPIRILSTLCPENPGTLILSEAKAEPGAATGIAGKKGFSTIYLEKDQMNAEVGFGRRVLSVLEERGISFEHMPSGIDTLSVLVETSAIAKRENEILAAMQKAVKPDKIYVEHNQALIAVVGRGMIRSPGCAAKLFTALAKAHINVNMMDLGSSQINMIVAVDEKEFERAVEAVYREFAPAEQ